MKRFYDVNAPKNQSYDAVAKRNNQKLETTPNIEGKQQRSSFSGS